MSFWRRTGLNHLPVLGRPCTLLSLISILLACSPGDVQEESPPEKRAETASPSPLRFSEHLIWDGYSYPYGIWPADLDGDGDLDLTSSDYRPNNSLYWFENDGSGNFTQRFIQKDDPERLERNMVGDINKDGLLDVAVVKNLHGHLIWFQNPGDPRNSGLWQRHVITTRLAGAYSVVLSDLDADGDLDAAASSWRMGNQFAWFENPGTPCAASSKELCYEMGYEWPKHLVEANVAETRSIQTADVDGDGDDDLLGTARMGGLVLWYENSGTPRSEPWKRHVIDTPKQPMHGETKDVDQDGDPDYMMGLSGDGEAVWYENDPASRGGPWPRHLIATLPGANHVTGGDLDGDGDLDAVATSNGDSHHVVWMENLGDPKGTWALHTLKDIWGKETVQVILADLDGNGRLDVAATSIGEDEFRWWRNEDPSK